MAEDYTKWTIEKLQRKSKQAWDMATLARQDGDFNDEARRTKEAALYDAELKTRLTN